MKVDRGRGLKILLFTCITLCSVLMHPSRAKAEAGPDLLTLFEWLKQPTSDQSVTGFPSQGIYIVKFPESEKNPGAINNHAMIFLNGPDPVEGWQRFNPFAPQPESYVTKHEYRARAQVDTNNQVINPEHFFVNENKGPGYQPKKPLALISFDELSAQQIADLRRRFGNLGDVRIPGYRLPSQMSSEEFLTTVGTLDDPYCQLNCYQLPALAMQKVGGSGTTSRPGVGVRAARALSGPAQFNHQSGGALSQGGAIALHLVNDLTAGTHYETDRNGTQIGTGTFGEWLVGTRSSSIGDIIRYHMGYETSGMGYGEDWTCDPTGDNFLNWQDWGVRWGLFSK